MKEGKIKDFTDLEIWQLGRKLTSLVYEITKLLLKKAPEEKWIMVEQVRRAVHSICANIAEAYGRYHFADSLNFLYHARGSLKEVKSFLLLIGSLYPSLEDLCNEGEVIADRLNVKLNNYIQSTRNRLNKT
ncbi:MAG: four helix bundle protein [Patescibacteria group bacterium]|nr:four helix bundle protein [Patescibacteria group bacterium]